MKLEVIAERAFIRAFQNGKTIVRGEILDVSDEQGAEFLSIFPDIVKKVTLKKESTPEEIK